MKKELEKKVCKEQKMATIVRTRFRWLEGRDHPPICTVDLAVLLFRSRPGLSCSITQALFPRYPPLVRSPVFPLTRADVGCNLFLETSNPRHVFGFPRLRAMNGNGLSPPHAVLISDPPALCIVVCESMERGLKRGLVAGLADWISQSESLSANAK